MLSLFLAVNSFNKTIILQNREWFHHTLILFVNIFRHFNLEFYRLSITILLSTHLPTMERLRFLPRYMVFIFSLKWSITNLNLNKVSVISSSAMLAKCKHRKITINLSLLMYYGNLILNKGSVFQKPGNDSWE